MASGVFHWCSYDVSCAKEDLWSEMRALLRKTPPSGLRCWGHEWVSQGGPILSDWTQYHILVSRGFAIFRVSRRKGLPLNLCNPPAPSSPHSCTLNHRPAASVATPAPRVVKIHCLGLCTHRQLLLWGSPKFIPGVCVARVWWRGGGKPLCCACRERHAMQQTSR